MSSTSIGNLSHVDQTAFAQEEEPVVQESQHEETVPTVTASEGEPREQTLQGLGSAFPEAGKAKNDSPIAQIPSEIATQIAQNADPQTRKAMRGTNKFFRNAVNPTVRKITLQGPEGAKGGSAISQAGSAFKSAEDISLRGDQFTIDHIKQLASLADVKSIDHIKQSASLADVKSIDHIKQLASFANVKSVSLNDPEGEALAELPRNLQCLRIGDDSDSGKVKDIHLAGLPPGLKTFVAVGNYITDAGLERVPRSVTSIALGFHGKSPQVTDAGLKKLPPNLKRILLTSTHFTDTGVRDLFRIQKNLQQVEILNPWVTGNIVRDIPDSVHTLSLPASYKSMGELANLPENVHTLTMPGDESQACNQIIASLPKSVKKLHLVGPLPPAEGEVSPSGLEKLRRENPGREITGESFNKYSDRVDHAICGGGDQPFV